MILQTPFWSRFTSYVYFMMHQTLFLASRLAVWSCMMASSRLTDTMFIGYIDIPGGCWELSYKKLFCCLILIFYHRSYY